MTSVLGCAIRSSEDVFEAMGAEHIDMGDLAERRVEGKKKKD